MPTPAEILAKSVADTKVEYRVRWHPHFAQTGCLSIIVVATRKERSSCLGSYPRSHVLRFLAVGSIGFWKRRR